MNESICYIFVRNKLISTDSFLPLALELKEKLNINSHFITFDKKTYNTINNNIVILDTIEYVGSLQFPATKFQKIKLLFKILIQLLQRKVYFFHFGHLNQGVIRILQILNARRTFFCEPDSSGFSKFMFEVDYAQSGRKLSLKKAIAPTHGHLLAFGDEWLWLTDPRVNHLPRTKVSHPRTLDSWKDFLIKKRSKYISLENLKPNVLTILLGFFGPTNITANSNTIEECFIETLEVLSNLDNALDYTIFLKPHPVTDLNKLKEITNRFKNLDLRITYAHPSLLATFSNFAICNVYSTAIYDFYIQGITSIEYTQYNQHSLDYSNGRSCRPEYIDYFINKDPNELRKVLSQKAENRVRNIKNNSNINEFLKLIKSL